METAPRPGVSLDVPVSGMSCAACSARLERVLARSPGVVSASVDLLSARASVVLEAGVDRAVLVDLVQGAGFEVPDAPPDEDAAAAAARQRQEELAARSGLARDVTWAALAGLPVMVLSMVAMHEPWSPPVQAALASFVVAVPGRRFFVDAWGRLRHGEVNMNTLVALGAAASLGLSLAGWLWLGPHALYFESAAMLVLFLLTGRWLEARARGAAAEAVRRLADLAPPRATVLRRGVPVEVAAWAVQTGDLVWLRPGEALAVDGVVEEGQGEVDASHFTGEPVPAPVGVGSAVHAGVVNGPAALKVRARAVGRDTLLAAVLERVRASQAEKARWQRLADRVAAVFVPAVLVLAGATLSGWWIVTGDLVRSLVVATSTVVVACPCALGLATPVALLVGTGAGARKGILLRGPEALERAARVDRVVFDKTGTLTRGELRVVQCSVDAEALAWAAAVEAGSEHPVARAIVAAAPRLQAPAEAVRASPGRGVSGTVQGHAVEVGVPAWLGVQGLHPEHTEVAVRVDGVVRGHLALADRLRPEAAEAVASLLRAGVKVAILSGDADGPVARVAEALGVHDAEGRCSPLRKAERVAAWQAAGEVVALVGDGVNDAPALAGANLGVAMGGGSAVAVHAADLALLRDDLRAVPEALALARGVRRLVRRNLGWAISYNLLTLPLAVAGVLTPMVASAAMAASSVSVVAYALWAGRRL